MCTFTVREDNIYPPPMLSTTVDFLVKKKALFYEGKYSLGNDPTTPIDCEFMMKYL